MDHRTGSFLTRHHAIGFDSNIIIAFVEDNPDFSDTIQAIFDEIAAQQLWLSAIGVTEILSKPIRQKQLALVRHYQEFLFSGQFHCAEISLKVARQAAELDLKVRDALHVASLMEAGVTGFVTADSGIRSIPGLEILTIRP